MINYQIGVEKYTIIIFLPNEMANLYILCVHSIL